MTSLSGKLDTGSQVVSSHPTHFTWYSMTGFFPSAGWCVRGSERKWDWMASISYSSSSASSSLETVGLGTMAVELAGEADDTVMVSATRAMGAGMGFVVWTAWDVGAGDGSGEGAELRDEVDADAEIDLANCGTLEMTTLGLEGLGAEGDLAAGSDTMGMGLTGVTLLLGPEADLDCESSFLRFGWAFKDSEVVASARSLGSAHD